MKYTVIRDVRSVGDFTPTGRQETVHYDNHVLHVIYTDVDGKPSVDKLKIKTALLLTLGVVEDLTDRIVDIEYGPRQGIVGVKVIGYRNSK